MLNLYIPYFQQVHLILQHTHCGAFCGESQKILLKVWAQVHYLQMGETATKTEILKAQGRKLT